MMTITDEPTSLYLTVFAQCILDAATTVLIFILIDKISRNKAISIIGATFYALHPAAIAYTSIIGTESVATFLLTLSVAVLIFAVKGERRSLFILAGAAFGIAALCRPIFLLFVLVMPALLLLFSATRRQLASLILFVFVAALAISPWIIRSYLVTDRFVLIQGLSVAQFYIASRYDLDQANEERLMVGLMEPKPGNDYIYRAYTAETPTEMIDAEKVGREQALANIKRSPGAYLRSRMERYPYLFLSSFDRLTGLNTSFGDAARNRNYFAFAVKAVLMFVFCVLPLFLGVFSFRLVRRNYALAVCGAIWVVTLIVHLPFWIEYRFWVPVIPLLTTNAMIGVWLLSGADRVGNLRTRVSD